MERKEELIEHLKKKLDRESYAFAERELKTRNTPFYRGETEYTKKQKEHFLIQAGRERTPKRIQILENVLYNVENAYNPTRVSNANLGNDSIVHKFLSNLLEPASKYFKTEYSEGSVIEYLVRNYDCDCPEILNQGSWLRINEREEELELYLENKKQAIHNLLEAFNNRGVRKEWREHTEESISHSITCNRFDYLTRVGEEFDKNPTAPEVISFIFELPSNSWGDKKIFFSCDTEEEMEALRDKYIKGYKKGKIRRELIHKIQSKLDQEYDTLLDAKLAEKGIFPDKENGYTPEQRKLISPKEIEVPEMLRRKQNLLEKISGYISSNSIVYYKESNNSDSEEIPF